MVDGDPVQTGPRILVGVSGPAVDATGIGPGFSGSPVTCPDAAGVPRRGRGDLRVGRRVRREGRAGDADRVGPRRAPAAPPQATAARSTRRRPRAAAVRSAVGQRRARPAGARARPRSAGGSAGRSSPTPAGPLGSYPAQTLRPGAAMAAGYPPATSASGRSGPSPTPTAPRYGASATPTTGVGRRSLLLQDAYVFRVINNPNVVEEIGTTYKLAASGHPLGALSDDTLACVGGPRRGAAAHHPDGHPRDRPRHRRAPRLPHPGRRRDRPRRPDGQHGAQLRRARGGQPGRHRPRSGARPRARPGLCARG